MSSYTELRSYQLVSNYGGVGSIIETLGGAMLIMPFDKWIFYKHVIEKADAEDLEAIALDDSRLLERAKMDFPDLEHLIIVPSNTTERGGAIPVDDKKIVSMEHFPKWFYCPKCKRFMDISDWDDHWRHKHPTRYAPDKHYTMCPLCADFNGRRSKLNSLEQVRFIQINDSGEVRDFPWQEWFTETTSSSKCTKHRLKYNPSSFSDNFESIHISCQDCLTDTTLRGIFGYPRVSDYKTVLRSSNNVYYPRIISSILIPGTKGGGTSDDSEFKLEEYDHIINMVSSGEYHDRYLFLKHAGYIGRIQAISIREMTMSSVLCSYTRGFPQVINSCYEIGRSKHVTSMGLHTKYLPAVRSKGEGFMLIFDDAVIKEWYMKNASEKGFSYAIERTIERDSSSFFHNSNSLAKLCTYAIVKTVLLHTISHLLMKQLEYTCGYPATSLNERVYASDSHHAGIIIYSITGSEGSYGGLISEVESKSLPLLLEDTIRSARFCRSDPVCYESGSVCFSCTLVPETSCELSNRYLDRSLLIDPQYGFVKYIFPDFE